MTYLALGFDTQEAALSAIATIDTIAEGWYAGNGYTIIEDGEGKGVVPKNAATGENEPNKAKVRTWATPILSPTGVWFFKSLSVNPEFDGWKDSYAALGGEPYTEFEFPVEWYTDPED
jgi:hypothetical protein